MRKDLRIIFCGSILLNQVVCGWHLWGLVLFFNLLQQVFVLDHVVLALTVHQPFLFRLADFFGVWPVDQPSLNRSESDLRVLGHLVVQGSDVARQSLVQILLWVNLRQVRVQFILLEWEAWI